MGNTQSTPNKGPAQRSLSGLVIKRMIERAKREERRRQTSIQNSAHSQGNSYTNYILKAAGKTISSFRFLDLPPELRDEIYKYHLLDCVTFRLAVNRCILVTSNLSLVCRQISNELEVTRLSPALLSGKTIVCTVYDCDFKPLIAGWYNFANTEKISEGLKDREMPKIIAKLCITEAWSEDAFLDGLREWYKWKGINSQIDVDYGVGDVQDVEEVYGFLHSLIFDEDANPTRDIVRMYACFMARYGQLVEGAERVNSLQAMQTDAVGYAVRHFGAFRR